MVFFLTSGATSGAMDAGNLLKPMLGRGELRCIGATTLDEYRKYIEKDPALERRFRFMWINQRYPIPFPYSEVYVNDMSYTMECEYQIVRWSKQQSFQIAISVIASFLIKVCMTYIMKTVKSLYDCYFQNNHFCYPVFGKLTIFLKEYK